MPDKKTRRATLKVDKNPPKKNKQKKKPKSGSASAKKSGIPRKPEINSHKSNNTFHSFFDLMPDPAVIMEPGTGRIIDVNKASIKLYGYTRNEFKKMNVLDISGEPGKTREAIKKLPKYIPIRYHRKKDGAVFPVEVTSRVVKIGGIDTAIAVGRDLTDRIKYEEWLRTAEKELAKARSIANIGDFSWDLEKNNFTWSEEFFKIFECEKGDQGFNFVMSMIHPEDREWIEEVLENALRGEDIFKVDFRIIMNDGKIKWLHNTSEIERDPKGKPSIIRGTVVDITERKLMLDALRRNERLYRAIVEDQNELICRFLPDGTLTFVNESYCRYFGKKSEELLGNSFYPFISEEDREKVRNNISKLTMKNPVSSLEEMVFDNNGNIRWQEWTNRAIYDEKGNFLVYQAIGRDITEHKLMLESLQKRETELSAIMNNAPIIMLLVDSDRRVVKVNGTLTKFAGRSEEEMIGLGGGEALRCLNSLDDPRGCGFGPNCPECIVRKTVTDTLETGVSHSRVEGKLPFNINGARTEITFILNTSLVDVKGEKNVLVCLEDITKKKKAESALQESERRYRLIVENINDAFYIHDFKGNILDCNVNACIMLGYEYYELVGTNLSKIDSPEDALLIEQRTQQHIMEGHIEFDGTHIRKDGTPIPVNISGKIVSREGNGVIHSFVRDITDRKTVQEALINAADEWRTTFDSMPDPVMLIDKDHSIVRANKAVRKTFGLDFPDILGKKCFRLVHGCNFPRDGCLHARTFFDGQIHKREVYLPDLEKHFLVTTSPIQKTPGEVSGTIHIMRDISDIKRMEQELQKSQKLESIGVLAGGIAHDFNNILTALWGNITLAKMQCEEDTKLPNFLLEAEKACMRARDLTRQLLTFARGNAPVKETTSLKDLIEDTSTFVLRGSKSKPKFFFPQDIPLVEVDKNQISQVVENIVINADQAMPDGGFIDITCQEVLLEQPGDMNEISISPGKYLEITIEDSGIGIKEEHLPKIFDPYWTTKPKGSGLGLSTCYSIIRKHEGHINVSSTLGEGTSFNIFLPISDKPLVRKTEPTDVQTGHGKILVMDDEESVRNLLENMLKLLGYTPESAADGKDVLDKYEEAMMKGDPYDAVLLDLTIPGGMGGVEAMRELLKFDPNVMAVICSGYFNETVIAEYEEYGFKGVVPKPIEIRILGSVLKKILQ